MVYAPLNLLCVQSVRVAVIPVPEHFTPCRQSQHAVPTVNLVPSFTHAVNYIKFSNILFYDYPSQFLEEKKCGDISLSFCKALQP